MQSCIPVLAVQPKNDDKCPKNDVFRQGKICQIGIILILITKGIKTSHMNDIFFFSFCQILFLIIKLDMTDIYISEEELSHEIRDK